jgi:hypothetical protein
MKKLMSILLGLSLVIGTASVAFCAEEKKEEKKEAKKKGKKAKKTEEEKKQ